MSKPKFPDNLFRVNIRISQDINQWFEARSMETGIAKSSLMALALSDYIDQKESIKAFRNLPENQQVKNG